MTEERTLWRFLLLSEWVLLAAQRCHKNTERAVEVYVVGVTVPLVLLWLTGGFGSAGLVIAAYRLVEILAVGAGLIAGSNSASVARHLHTIGLYGVQMALIFAIFLQVSVSDASNWAFRPTDPIGWLYLSVTNLLTRGNQFDPKSWLAQGIVMLNLVSGVFLLSVFVAFAVSKLPNRS